MVIDNIIKRFWEKIELKYKLIFFISLIISILTHGMAFFNKYAMHDEAAYYLFENGMSDWWRTGGTYKAGRWMLGIIGQISGLLMGDNISSSTFAGIVSVLCLIISSCLIAKILRIRSTFIAVLIGILMVTSPVIVGLFGFMYIAPHYLFGLVLGYVGTLIVCEKQSISKRWILGIILIGASVGTYQAYIPCFLSLMLFCYIRDDCLEEKPLNRMLKDAAYYMVSALSFMIIYFVLNKVFLSFLGFELIDYKGINNMTSLDGIFTRFINVFRYFFFPSNRVADVIYPMTIRYIYYFFTALWGLFTILFLLNKKFIKNSKTKKMVSLLVFLCVPFVINFIYLECDAEFIGGHMAYGQIMIYIFFLFFADIILINSSYKFNLYHIFAGLVLLMVCFTCVFYVRFDNVTYIKSEIVQERLISWSNELVTRIKSTKGYNEKLPVLYVGWNSKSDGSVKNIEDFNYIVDIPYQDIETQINDYAFNRFVSIWTGYTPTFSYDIQDVENTEEYKVMTCYPNDGSISVINGKVVVKFAE